MSNYQVCLRSLHSVILRCANPAYTVDELVHQLRTTKAFVLVSHPGSLPTALDAARQAGLAADHIFLIDELHSKSPIPLPTISDLVGEGLGKPATFTERRLAPGEAKTKLAFLSFSSGTTGRPKVRSLWIKRRFSLSFLNLHLGRCYPALRRYRQCHPNGNFS